ncbi:MAG: FKBP-type peptidyl-prolyl cis-trans isomerase [Chlorobi bacterium]|nr:FKBP-type peptidyl-prolyl cis-trans isomerase [Chlorobiota bacterium]
MKLLLSIISVTLSLFVASTVSAGPIEGSNDSNETITVKSDSAATVLTTKSGLQYVDIKIGEGAYPKIGQTCKVHYHGTFENGEVFDSSVERNKPFKFRVGVGQVIKGWDEGIISMKVGGKRKLIVPPHLGYGSRARGKIPANSTLIFEVEFLEIK